MMLELNKIYCGDCLDLMREMPDKSVDLVLTDPPYGIGEDGGHCRTRGSDHMNGPKMGWDDAPPIKEYFDEILRVSQNQIIFGGNYFTDKLPVSRGWIYWQKDMGGDFADGELAWTSFDRVLKQFKKRSETFNRVHPTQKPLKLMEWCLQRYSEPGMSVLDPFLGSGTTAVACKKLGRNYIGIEKEPAYIEIALKRLEKVNNHKLGDFWDGGWV